MRKRLRKKLCRAEFREYVCLLEAVTTEQVIDNIIDYVEQRGMYCVGAFNTTEAYAYIHREGESVTNEDREALAEWAKTVPAIKSFHVTGLMDPNDMIETWKKSRISWP